MDTNALVQSASKVGHTDIPVGSGNNSEAADVLKQIFAANEGKFFRSGDLQNILNEGGVSVTKVGNVLFQMKNQKQCSQVKKGVYTSYNSEYDANITSPKPAATSEVSEEAAEE